ncbi:hypothetical protein [Auritidibacter ignavus]|uniref:hypothetical protein n=1 Tax=Auritidibacter ignavus TaxID=678932 RepID=UPI0024BA6993|nr:hypothetical protein [Auritidibacter ignavus]WHS27532.1 hypothetical protein QM395_09135 [Auritidibacter ignavus]
MPFRESALMPPVFQSPRGDRRDHKPPVVSIKPSGEPMESGIRLHHNQRREGYFLKKDVEGLGVAPVSVEAAELASGGSVFRHARLEAGDMFLPIHLHTPVPSTLPQMFDRLVQIVQPGQKRFFDVIVFDPYSPGTRTRKLMATEITDPTRHNYWWWTVGITAQFFDPFWYGQVRELRRRLGNIEKKFITAKPDPNGYEFPFFPVRIGGSVVQGEYELQVAGDAPAYWSAVVTPPGEDLLIQNAQGERIFVHGRVDEPILIQTRPQEQDITLADGTPIWDRIDPGDDDFFPLHPGRNHIHVSMVGANQQSEILIRYREAFFHAIGGGS